MDAPTKGGLTVKLFQILTSLSSHGEKYQSAGKGTEDIKVSEMVGREVEEEEKRGKKEGIRRADSVGSVA